MKKYAIGLAVGVALTLALAAVGVARDKESDDARKDVLDVVKLVEAGKDKDVAAKVAAIKKKDVELNYLMKVYKLKKSGGLGYGSNPGPNSGLETRLNALQGGPALAPGALKQEEVDLIKLAHVNLAMAEIARPYFPGKMNGKVKKDWDGWLDDQKKASRELIVAVKAGKGADVVRAAKNLQDSCVECHRYFRQ